MEFFFHGGEKFGKRLLLSDAAAKQAVGAALGIGAFRGNDLDLLQTKGMGQYIVDTAGCQVQIGVGIDTGNTVFH